MEKNAGSVKNSVKKNVVFTSNLVREKAQVSSSSSSPSSPSSISNQRRKSQKAAIDFLDSACLLLFHRPLLLPSVLFGSLWVVFEEQAQRGKAKQKGLDEPQAASGCVGDTFVTAEHRDQKRSEGKTEDAPRTQITKTNVSVFVC